MKLVNCTPHVINVISADGTEAFKLPPSGIVARAASRREVVGSVDHDGAQVPLARVNLSAIENLPEAEDGTMFVVSALAGQAAKAAGRSDVLLVDDAVRDPEGRIIGCRAFALP